jgi:hypothetical protein
LFAQNAPGVYPFATPEGNAQILIPARHLDHPDRHVHYLFVTPKLLKWAAPVTL